MKKTSLQTLEELLKIKSISQNKEACKEIIDFVKDLFSDTSYKTMIFEKNEVYSLVVSKKEELDYDLALLGHLDVVPGVESSFIPIIEGNKIYGRGVADMKGSCFSMIELFLEHENDPLFNNHALIFTTDEEVGGFDGVGYLVNELGLKVKTLFNPDGGDHFIPCVEEKGILMIEFITNGKAAHGSTPWNGENAIEKLLEDIEIFKNLYDFAKTEDEWNMTYNLGQISGGNAVNTVPSSASAKVDIRYPSSVNADNILQKVRENIKHSTINTIIKADAVRINEDNKFLQKFLNSLEKFGYDRKVMKECGGSDARWFSKQETNILLMLPNCSDFHVENEWLDLESLEKFKLVLEDFINMYYQ